MCFKQMRVPLNIGGVGTVKRLGHLCGLFCTNKHNDTEAYQQPRLVSKHQILAGVDPVSNIRREHMGLSQN